MPSIATPVPAQRAPIESGPWPKAPFPDIKTHPLLVIDYQKIASGDGAEADKLFQACSTLGFFYLNNYGFEDNIEPMFAVGEETFRLPLEELLKFEQGDSGRTCGFKRAGGSNVDAKGNLDTVEFMNVSKDDALAYPEVRQRTYPDTINRNMPTITNFIKNSDTVLKKLIAVLEPRVGLKPGVLQNLHANGPPHLSGSEARLIYKPFSGAPGALKEGVGEDGNPAAAIGSHTDFGSCKSLLEHNCSQSLLTYLTFTVSMLHGRGCGGLQVLPPGSSEWQYIRPLPGHAVCNVGDTLCQLTKLALPFCTFY